MNKKMIKTGTLFIIMLFIVPILSMMFFSGQTEGKLQIDKKIDAPYLKDTSKSFAIVYFGYVGCTKVCTPILYRLHDLYRSEEFATLRSSCNIVFINLKPDVSPEQPQRFASFFDPEFEGVYLTQSQLMKVDRSFALFFARSLKDTTEIDHSDYVYLIEHKRDGNIILKNLYSTHPLPKSEIVSDLLKYMKEEQK